MNYLAHVYLSGSDKDLIIGNFIADHVKGKAYLDIPRPFKRDFIGIGKLMILPIITPYLKRMSLYCFHNSATTGSLSTCFSIIFWLPNGSFIILTCRRLQQAVYPNVRILGKSPVKLKILPIISKYNWFGISIP